MAHDVTLITGDGTGPELAEAARKCVDATGVKINWDEQEAGVDVMDRAGTPLPESVLESVRRTKCALKAPITTPVGTGFRSINVHLRQELGLFACIRPCKYYPGVRSFSAAFRSTWSSSARTPRTSTPASNSRRADRTRERADRLGQPLLERPQIKSPRRDGGDRSSRSAFPGPNGSSAARSIRRVERPQEGHRVHKANIMKYSDGLFWTAGGSPRSIRTSSSRTGSSTTCACSLCRNRSCTT